MAQKSVTRSNKLGPEERNAAIAALRSSGPSLLERVTVFCAMAGIPCG